MTNTIKPLDTGDTGGRRVMRPPRSLDVIRAIPKQEPTPPIETSRYERLQDKDRYVLLEGEEGLSDDLLVAIDRTHQGANWYNAHKALHAQGARMLTLYQFARLLHMVLDDSQIIVDGLGNPIDDPLRETILDNLLGPCAEWFDLLFRGDTPPNIFHTEHDLEEGRTRSRSRGTLEPYLTSSPVGLTLTLQDWLENHTAQGLPQPGLQSDQKQLRYIPPAHGRVVRFGKLLGELTLRCNENPSIEDSCLGVRAVYVLEYIMQAPGDAP